MHVLVTGGTGLVGKSSVDQLLERGHTVRLFARNAERDCYLWESGVEAYAGSVGRDEDVHGAAEGCDGILHIVGIVDEVPPDATFDNINVLGTRRIVREAERAGVRRLVYVSSLGADRGRSEYHRSKRAGEEIAKEFAGDWLICRPGNVYGPGDQVISLLLKMVRTLPAIPVIGGGDQPFQPIRAQDLAVALALAVEWEEPAREVLELAGGERVTMNELLDIFELITDRSPTRIPIPESVALAGAALAEFVGVEIPINGDQIVMLLEENVIPPERTNALTEVFGVTPVLLTDGLAELADSLPEQLPQEGYGSLHRQRYWADIQECGIPADELFEMICRDFHALTPEGLVEVGAEPGTPKSIHEGATLTMAIPLRGNIQVRVEEVEGRTITCVTVEGHHLAGIIRFIVREIGELVRFEVRSYSRASRMLDSVGMAAVGRRLQKATWRGMVEEVVRRAGGYAASGVEEDSSVMTDREAARIERWIEERVITRRREQESSKLRR
jgi:uncharacterized protein YbjT (DUF2867 family)